MDIESIRAVYAVYTYGSYFEAAYQLSMDYSVLSKKISKVENEFGIKIFKRALRGHPLSLTDEGSKVIKQIKRTVDAYDSLIRDVHSLRNSQQKMLRIGYWRSSGSFDETELIAGFFSDHPEFQLKRTISNQDELIAALGARKLDCIFISDMGHLIDEISSETFNIIPLAGLDEMHLLVNRDHPLAKKTVIKKNEFGLLAGESLVFDSRQTPETPDHLLDFFGIKDSAKKIFVDYTDMAVAYSLVRQGKGIMASLRRMNITDDRIRVIDVEGWQRRCILYLVYPKDKLPSGLKEFIFEALDFYGNRSQKLGEEK